MLTPRPRYFKFDAFRFYANAVAVTALATVVLATTRLVQSEETYLLQDRYAVGDVFEEENTMDMNFSIDATAAGKTLPPMKFTMHERQRHRDEVLAVTANGKIDGFRRFYAVDQTTETMPDSSSKTTASTLQGKTIAVRRKNGRPVVTVAKGKIADVERKKLSESLDSHQTDFFPTQQVAIGAEWKIPAKTLATMFAGTDTATATGKLVEFVTYDNRQCAHVKVTINLSGKLSDSPLKMTMKLTGDLYQAMDTQRPLSLNAQGPLTISGADKGPKGKIVMKGTGTMKAETAYNWIKIAGKTVDIEPIVVQ